MKPQVIILHAYYNIISERNNLSWLWSNGRETGESLRYGGVVNGDVKQVLLLLEETVGLLYSLMVDGFSVLCWCKVGFNKDRGMIYGFILSGVSNLIG